MLNIIEFTAGMQQLGTFYINFTLTDKQTLIWYESFKNLTPEQYKTKLVEFMNKSKYAPSNPNQILNIEDSSRVIEPPNWLAKQIKQREQAIANDRLLLDEKIDVEEVKNLINKLKR